MKNAYELAENILKSKPDKNIELKSSDSFASIELYGTSACKKVQDTEFCECFHLENESGTGMITLYHVFPGIDLVYNDMHMEYCNKEQKPASSVMEINYCMEGRCECVFEQNEYGYIAAGDLSFCSLKKFIYFCCIFIIIESSSTYIFIWSFVVSISFRCFDFHKFCWKRFI